MYPNIINKSTYCLKVKHGMSLLYNTNRITVFREIIANRLFENYGKSYTLRINAGFYSKIKWKHTALGVKPAFLTLRSVDIFQVFREL